MGLLVKEIGTVDTEIKLPWKVCLVEKCDWPAVSLGYCHKHYQRFKRHGDPLVIKRARRKQEDGTPEICLIDGCGKNVASRRYCSKHYVRFRKHGDPLIVKRRGRHAAIVQEERDRLQRLSFEKLHGPGSVEKLKEMLKRPCNTLEEIGHEFGISSERIRQLYERLFPDDDRPKHYRRKVCTVTRPRLPYSGHFPASTLFVWRAARKHGLTVKSVNHKSGTYAFRNRLLIGERRCKIAHTDKLHVPNVGSPGYTHFHSPLWDWLEFFIAVRTALDGSTEIFILPREIVKSHDIFIPFSRSTYHGGHTYKTDWLSYRDRWDLIGEEDLLEKVRTNG